MRYTRLLPAVFAGLVFAGLTFTGGIVNAEQIRLSDGSFLQGEVTEVKEDGFTFKLTESGGKVFLRWSQVDAALKKRLTNDTDPDEGLNLEVTVLGSRIELIDGTVYEGDVRDASGGYNVSNRELGTKPRFVSSKDVLEDGVVHEVQIDATVMMTEREALALAEAERQPETAKQFYELARIADALGLYAESKDYVTLALAAGPDSKLQVRLTEYEAKLDDLIRQQGLLTNLTAARQLAKKKKFKAALTTLENAKTQFNPTDSVLDKWNETYAEIDLDFTKYVITEWYKQLRPIARVKVKDKKLTVNEAINWARREMDNEIARKLTVMVGGDTTAGDDKNIKQRFGTRFDLETQAVMRLSLKKASFGEKGFYQIVGGHLPVAGKKPAATTPAPGNPGSGPRNPRGDRNGNVVPQNPQDFEDLFKDFGKNAGKDGRQFQDSGKMPGGLPDINEEELRDIMRRVMGEDKPGGNNPQPGGAPQVGAQDLSDLKVPEVVPTLTEWFDDAGDTAQGNWLVAVYVKFSGTMRIYELDRWDIKFK